MVEQLLNSVKKMGEAGIYFVFGIAMLFLGRFVWNMITKYNANNEIGEVDNESAGIAEFGFIVALSLIILSSIMGVRKAGVPIYVDLLISFIWTVFGLIALAVGKFALEKSTPFKLDEEIARDKNPSAGWLQAGFYIAIGLIIFGVI